MVSWLPATREGSNVADVLIIYLRHIKSFKYPYKRSTVSIRWYEFPMLYQGEQKKNECCTLGRL